MAFAAQCIAAPVAAQTYDPARIVKSVETADLVALVRNLDHEVIETSPEQGDRSLLAKDADGFVYSLSGTACDANGVSGCQGVMMQVRFDAPEGLGADAIMRASLQIASISTWLDRENNTLGMTRYVVLDHGVTLANLRENVLVLLASAPAALDVVTGKDAP